MNELTEKECVGLFAFGSWVRIATWVDENLFMLIKCEGRFVWVVINLPPKETWSPKRSYCLVQSMKPASKDLMAKLQPLLLRHIEEQIPALKGYNSWVAFNTFPPWKFLLKSPHQGAFKQGMVDYVKGLLDASKTISVRSLFEARKSEKWRDKEELFASMKPTDETAHLPLYHGTYDARELENDDFGIFFATEVTKAMNYGLECVLETACPPELRLPVLDNVAHDLSDRFNFYSFGIRNMPKLLSMLDFEPEFVIAYQCTGIEVVVKGTNLKSSCVYELPNKRSCPI